MQNMLRSLSTMVAATVLLGAQAMPSTVPMAPARAALPADGITVRGSGSATGAATSATLSLYISARNNATTITASSLAPVVDALVRSGIDRTDITLPVYMTPAAHTNNATITATIRQPTPNLVQNGITQLSNTFASMPDLLLNSAQVRLTLDDCAALARQAQSIAIKRARANAETIARQLGLHIGAVVAVDEQSGSLNNDGRCSSGYAIGPYQNMPFAVPSDYLAVRVYSTVTIRYAIR